MSKSNPQNWNNGDKTPSQEFNKCNIETSRRLHLIHVDYLWVWFSSSDNRSARQVISRDTTTQIGNCKLVYRDAHAFRSSWGKVWICARDLWYWARTGVVDASTSKANASPKVSLDHCVVSISHSTVICIDTSNQLSKLLGSHFIESTMARRSCKSCRDFLRLKAIKYLAIIYLSSIESVIWNFQSSGIQHFWWIILFFLHTLTGQ